MSIEELVFHSKEELRDYIENMDDNVIINISIEKEESEVVSDVKRTDDGE